MKLSILERLVLFSYRKRIIKELIRNKQTECFYVCRNTNYTYEGDRVYLIGDTIYIHDSWYANRIGNSERDYFSRGEYFWYTHKMSLHVFLKKAIASGRFIVTIRRFLHNTE